MNKFVKILLTLVALLVVNPGFAQEVEIADTMRANGKIYVVVGIIVIILVGLMVYLFTIDKKISKLEKELDKHSS